MHPVFNNGIYWHQVMATLFQGGAIVMVVAVAARFIWRQDWYIRGINMRLATGTAVALLAVWNLIFAVLAMFTGVWMTWGFEAVTSMSLTINKAMLGSFALLSLVMMVWLRYRYGPGLWRSASLRNAYSALGLIAGIGAVVNGSLGGEASLIGTILEPVWALFNVNVRAPMVLPAAGGITFVIVILLVVAVTLVIRGGGRTPTPEITQGAVLREGHVGRS